METSKGGIKSEAQMSIRSAKAAILVSSLNRQLRSLTNHRDNQSERNVVAKLTREVEDLKIKLVMEKVKNKMMDRCHILMEFLLLQILIVILIIAVCFVYSFTFHEFI